MKAIGAYLRGLRKGQHLTLLDVAIKASPVMGSNFDPSYVQKIEKASVKTSPSFKHVMAVVAALRASYGLVRDLLGRDDVTPREAERLGERHALYLANDTTWMADLSEDEKARLRAFFDGGD